MWREWWLSWHLPWEAILQMKSADTYTTLRTVPGGCKHSRSLSFSYLLQDKDLIHGDKWQRNLRQMSGLWGRHLGVGWPLRKPFTWHCMVLLCGKAALPGAQAHLWWAKLTRTGPSNLQTVSGPDHRTQALSLHQPWNHFLFSLSLPPFSPSFSFLFLLSPSPPPPQAWPSPPHPCLWTFLHLEIRSKSGVSPQPTFWPLAPASPTPSRALAFS